MFYNAVSLKDSENLHKIENCSSMQWHDPAVKSLMGST